jgi:Rod binding domain-containing protein
MPEPQRTRAFERMERKFDVMAELGLPALPTDMLAQKKAAPNVADVKTRAQAEQVAQQFERMFIAEMLGPMFQGLETDGPFSGGNAEATFRPMLIDQYADAIAKGGGVGIAESVLKEILKMQGLE